MRELKVIVDPHEPNEVKEILRILGAHFEVRALSVGDLMDEAGRVVIERKSLNDLINSATGGRLWSQLHRLSASIGREKIVLLIHGIKTSNPFWKWSDLMGLIASIAIRYPIQVIWAPDLRSALLIAVRMIKKAGEGKIGKPKPAPISSELRMRLARFLGIPTSTCDRLLYRFKTVSGIVKASVQELKQVRGIGDRYARQIRQRLTEPLGARK